MQYIQIEIMKSTCSGYATISYHICNATKNRWYVLLHGVDANEFMNVRALWIVYICYCCRCMLFFYVFIVAILLTDGTDVDFIVQERGKKISKAFYRHHFHIYCILEYCSDVKYKNLIELGRSLCILWTKVFIDGW